MACRYDQTTRQMIIEPPVAYQGLYKPYTYKAIRGGRGSAKTYSIIEALVTMALLDAYPQKRFCFCRELIRSIDQSVRAEIIRIIEDMGAMDEVIITQKELVFPRKGSIFFFAGLRDTTQNVASFKGMSDLDVTFVEEAETIGANMIQAMRPTAIRKDGSELWFAWNTKDGKSYVDDIFFNKPFLPNTLALHTTYKDNPYISNTMLADIEADKISDYDMYLHTWEGEPLRISEANVFRDISIQDLDAEVEHLDAYYGMDLGFKNDPTALTKCFIIPEKNTLYIADELVEKGLMISEYPAFINEVFRNKVGEQLVCDNQDLRLIADLKAKGFNIIPCTKGAGSVERGLKRLKDFKLVFHPDCMYSYGEFYKFQYKVLPNGEITPTYSDKDNHTIDATRYAIQNTYKMMPIGRSGFSAPSFVQTQRRKTF